MIDDDSRPRFSDKPTVTVVVPVYNDVERLRICLAALAAQDYPADRFDVVVADNASTQDVRPALPTDDPRFAVVREPRKGSYVARNTAVAQARGEVLAFTDADCIPHADWLSEGVRILTSGDDAPDSVGGDVHLVFRNSAGPTSGPELYEAWEGFNQREFVTDMHFAATANLIVPTRVFHRVGEFDASLQSGGDLEWGRRLHSLGLTMGFAPDAVIDHPSRPTWRELTRKTIRIANGHIDLSRNPATADFVAGSWHDVRQTFTVWRWIWGAEWPTTRGAKFRFAAARSYAGLLELWVRCRRRILR